MKQRMKLSVIAAAPIVLVATLVPAIFDGTRSFRWGIDTEVQELANRLDNFPTTIGDWVARPSSESEGGSYEIPLDRAARDQLQPITYINRRYHCDGQFMDVFVLLGATGPTAVHTPDICFGSTEFKQLGKRKPQPVEDGTGSSCFLSQFQSRKVSEARVQSWYAWTADGILHSPEQPRFYFARNRYLIKVQVVSWHPNQEDLRKSDEHCRSFVTEIAKTLRRQLF